jgi:hypothetical protein
MDDKCLVWCSYRSGMPYPRRRRRRAGGDADADADAPSGSVATGVLDALRALPEALHAMVAYTRLEPPPPHGPHGATAAAVGGFSDAGWGCTVRSTQMLAATALLRARAAAGERVDRAHVARLLVDWPPGVAGGGGQDAGGDNVDDTGALSLPAFVVAGRAMSGKPAGAWYGPHEACHVLQRLAAAGTPGAAGLRLRPPMAALAEKQHHQGADAADGDGPRLAVLVCNDATVVRSEVLAAAAAGGGGGGKNAAGGGGGSGSAWRHPVLALVPLRLGLERTVPHTQLPALGAHMRLPAFAGALGGWPRHSVFVTGLAPAPAPAPGAGDGDDEEGRPDADADATSHLQQHHRRQQRHRHLLLSYLDPHVVQATPAPPSTPPPLPATAAPDDGAADAASASAAGLPLPQWYVDSLAPPAPGRPGAAPGPLDAGALDPCLALSFLLGSPGQLDAFTASVGGLARAGLQLFAVVDAPLRPPDTVFDAGSVLAEEDDDGGGAADNISDGSDGSRPHLLQRRFEWLREPEAAGAHGDGEQAGPPAGGLLAARTRSTASLAARQQQQRWDGGVATTSASPPVGRRCRSEPSLPALSLGLRRPLEGPDGSVAAAAAAAASPPDSPPPSPAAPSSPYVDVGAVTARAAAGGSPGDGAVLVALPGVLSSSSAAGGGSPCTTGTPAAAGVGAGRPTGGHGSHLSRGSWTELPPPALAEAAGAHQPAVGSGGGGDDGSATAPSEPPAAAPTALRLLLMGGGGGSGAPPPQPPPPLRFGGRVHQLQQRHDGALATPTPTTAATSSAGRGGGGGGGGYDDTVVVLGPTPGGDAAPTPYDMLLPSVAAPTPAPAEEEGEAAVGSAAPSGAATEGDGCEDVDSGPAAASTAAAHPPMAPLAGSSLFYLLPPPPLLPPSPASTTASAADTAGTGSTRSVAAPPPATPSALRPGGGASLLLLPSSSQPHLLHPRMARSEGPPHQAAAGRRGGGSVGAEAAASAAAVPTASGAAARGRVPARSSPLLRSVPTPAAVVVAAAGAADPDPEPQRHGQLLR